MKIENLKQFKEITSTNDYKITCNYDLNDYKLKLIFEKYEDVIEIFNDNNEVIDEEITVTNILNILEVNNENIQEVNSDLRFKVHIDFIRNREHLKLNNEENVINTFNSIYNIELLK